MSLSSLIKPLAAAGIAAAALASCKPGDVSRQPPVHINPNMDTQEKYKAQSQSKFFEDGRTSRTPVAGTVAHGSFIADLAVAEGKDAAGNWVKAVPSLDSLGFKGDMKAFLERGKSRFNISCIPCHGELGAGNGIVAQKGYPGVANLIDPLTAARLSPGQIYAAIKNGVNNGNMRKFDAELNVSDRWAVTAYVLFLQQTLVKKVEVAAGAAPDAERGKALYASCLPCHSTAAGIRLVGPSLHGIMGSTRKFADGSSAVADEAFIAESVRNPGAKIAEGFPPAMPPLPLTDAQVKDLVEYLKTLK
ncbi:MAG: hypothetical protein RL095_1047 [Verrucomicrobiota bacterium]|jgi:mono/diheme cytochrome c family protein